MNAVEDVTVVCVTYNSAGVLPTLLTLLAPFPRIVFVDNASADFTLTLIDDAPVSKVLIKNSENVGFGAANNQALAQVSTPFALLLNPDCSIDVETASKLLKCAHTFPSAALIAPQAITPKGELQECYGFAFYRAQPKTYRAADAVVGAQWLSGCCLLLRMDCFPGRRAFDERFFLYYEDDDLALDVQRRGYECIFLPDAIVKHAGGSSSGRAWRTQLLKDFHYQRSKILIIRKYLGLLKAIVHRVKLACAGFVAIPIYALLLRRKYLIRWTGWFAAAIGISMKP
jgi:N-acetylglucosaminyl-diphospho-decaprenol L-rhamnosyltransferase